MDFDSTAGFIFIGALALVITGLFVAVIAGTRAAALLGMREGYSWWFSPAGGRTQGIAVAYVAALVAVAAFVSLGTSALVPDANALSWALACLAFVTSASFTITRMAKVVLKAATRGTPMDYDDADVVEPDLALDDIDVRTARTAAVLGDWRPAAQLLAATNNQDVRFDRIRVLAHESLRHRQWLESWAKQEPSNSNITAVRLQLGTERAWVARGGEQIPQNIEEFFKLLDATEKAAREAIERTPNDPVPHIVLVTLARGQEVDDVEFAARLGGLLACSPHSRAGHEQALQYLAPKWFGSAAQVHAFARAGALAAEAGAALKLLPVLAHIEQWVGLEMDGNKDAKDHMTAAATRRDICAARDAWMAGPGSQPSPIGTAWGHNVLAFAFWLADLPDDAEPHLAETRNHLAPDLWGYCGEPEMVHAHVQGWVRRR